MDQAGAGSCLTLDANDSGNSARANRCRIAFRIPSCRSSPEDERAATGIQDFVATAPLELIFVCERDAERVEGTRHCLRTCFDHMPPRPARDIRVDSGLSKAGGRILIASQPKLRVA